MVKKQNWFIWSLISMFCLWNKLKHKRPLASLISAWCLRKQPHSDVYPQSVARKGQLSRVEWTEPSSGRGSRWDTDKYKHASHQRCSGAGMRLQSLNRRETWRVSRHLPKSSQTPISAHRGVKVLCFSGKCPLKGEGRSSGPRWGLRLTDH